MSEYVSLECPKHGWSDVDTSSVGCPDCEIDHIHRERTLAKIAVLEEMQAALFKFNGGTACYFEADWLAEKIAALRKELENG